MSEEEILKQLDNACILDKNCYGVDYLFEKDLEAIRSLLDLYNKEKDKNASLKKEIKLMKSININDNYISKNEIRERITQLEALDKQYYKKVIAVLEKILEEE